MQLRRLLPAALPRPAVVRSHVAKWIRNIPARTRVFVSSVDRRALRVFVPAVVAVGLLPFVLPMVPMELKEPLFGDTVVYQYVSWAVRHGLKLYSDIGMMDGPFIHFFMAGMQAIVGITDRGFRKCDLVIHASGSAIVGALLAPTVGLGRPGRFFSRLSWAMLASILWMAWYFTLTWTTTTEREVYYSLFGSIGMVLLYVSRDYSRRSATIAIGIGAALVTSQIFGKPTGIMYPAVGSLCILLQDSKGTTTLGLRCRAFAIGAGICILAAVVALALYGSFRGYLFWSVTIPYRENRFLWRQDWHRVFLVQFDWIRQAAILSLVSGVAAIGFGLLPVRALGFALLPPIAFMGFCLQARGYNYQAIPVEISGIVLTLVLLSAIWPPYDGTDPFGWRGMLAMAFMTGLAYHAFVNVEASPYRWSGDESHWSAPCSDHYADTEKDVGLYIKEHTHPGDKGFACCGNSHAVLLYAERPTASPFFHGVWLDSVSLVPESEVQPTPAQLDALKDLQAKIRDITCTAVERNRPVWMAFDNLAQVYGICPNLAGMLLNDYKETKQIEAFHIYKRKPHH